MQKMCWKETFNFSSWMKVNPCKWNCIYHAANQSAATDVIHQSKMFLHKLSIKDNGINLVCWIPNWKGKEPALLFQLRAHRAETTVVPGGASRSPTCTTSHLPPQVSPSQSPKGCKELPRSAELLRHSQVWNLNRAVPRWGGTSPGRF